MQYMRKHGEIMQANAKMGCAIWMRRYHSLCTIRCRIPKNIWTSLCQCGEDWFEGMFFTFLYCCTLSICRCYWWSQNSTSLQNLAKKTINIISLQNLKTVTCRKWHCSILATPEACKYVWDTCSSLENIERIFQRVLFQNFSVQGAVQEPNTR